MPMTNPTARHRRRFRHGWLLWGLLAAAAGCLGAGCYSASGGAGIDEPTRGGDEEALIARIRLSMNRAEAERILNAAGLEWEYFPANDTIRAWTGPRTAALPSRRRIQFEIRLAHGETVVAVKKSLSPVEP